MSESKVITRKSQDGMYIIIVSGDFSFLTLDEFRTAYSSNECKSSRKHIVDLSKTKTVDSSALGMILNMQSHLEKADKEIEIRGSNEQILRVFKITNFARKFKIEGIEE